MAHINRTKFMPRRPTGNVIRYSPNTLFTEASMKSLILFLASVPEIFSPNAILRRTDRNLSASSGVFWIQRLTRTTPGHTILDDKVAISHCSLSRERGTVDINFSPSATVTFMPWPIMPSRRCSSNSNPEYLSSSSFR